MINPKNYKRYKKIFQFILRKWAKEYQEFYNLIDNRTFSLFKVNKRISMRYFRNINPFLLSISLIPMTFLFTQYKWTRFADNPNFEVMSDPIDSSQIIYHKDAENNWNPANDKGILFSTHFRYYPSPNSSIEWINEIKKKGRISFYPHIYNEQDGKSSLLIAILYYIEKAVSYKNAYNAPDFIRSDILEFNNQKMNFEKIKFISGDFVLSLPMNITEQEIDVRKNGNFLNYIYWIKSDIDLKKLKEIKSFFRNPFETLQIRAYTDKGYIDTEMEGRKMKNLSEIFMETSSLSEIFKQAYELKLLSQKPKIVTNTVTNMLIKRPRMKKRRIVTTEPKTVRKEITITNQRPVSSRIVIPR